MRLDYAYPFRIDPASGQALQVTYEMHVDQMVRQILLTAPGERVDLPDFGCGLRSLLFAPNSIGLQSAAKVNIQQSLNKWLSNQITVQQISVTASDDASQLLILVQYTLLETGQNQTTEVRIV